MSKEAMKLALEAAYLAGWNASGEGYNAEYPFGDHARNPEEDAAWIKGRDNALREALAEQPAQQEPVAFYVYKPTLPRGNLGNVSDGDLPWVYDQDPSSGYSARMLVYTTPPPCQTCEALARTVMMDQTGRGA